MEFGRILSKYQTTLLVTMMMFKLGILCTASAESCLSSPCQNGGTCLESMGAYACLCPTGPDRYTGKNCQYLDLDECQSNPCNSVRSRCLDGVDVFTCHCPQGYTGEDCQETARDCSEEPCLNGATCQETPEGHECLCAPGYEGPDCGEDVDECWSEPCQNGAICKDRVNGYQCFCVPGFQGSQCGMDINECVSRPCENNGTCVDEVDRYRCDCQLGYQGLNCEAEIDECEERPCQNGAACRDHVGAYSCDCEPGFDGHDCQINVDECASAPCLNEGACVDLVNSYECDCGLTGFMGQHCEQDIPECASEPCQHGGTCVEGVNQYSCTCWPGYEGSNCQVDINECEVEPCENSGQCFQRSEALHYGVLPELKGEFTYQGAAGYLCHCLPGFKGESCAVNIDECQSDPCQNRATCLDMVNSFQCVCAPGFTGVLCQVDVDECESQPCQNGAWCEDAVDGYVCRCPEAEPDREPWGGRHCDVTLTGCQGHACDNGATCVPALVEGQHSYTCSCAPGYTGPRCDVSTTFSFSEDGYLLIQLPAANRTRRQAEDPADHQHGLRVRLRFRTTLPNVLLFHAAASDHSLSLEVVDGFVQLSSQSRKPLEVKHQVSNGEWYEVSVTTNETLALVVMGAGCEREGCKVDNKIHNHLMFPQWSSYSQLFVGGAPSESLLRPPSQTGFLGCMQDLEVNHQLVLPQDLAEEQARHLDLGCNKTERCFPDTCSERGRCVDLWVSSRCDCDRPYYGDSCEEEYKSWTFSPENLLSYASYNLSQSLGDNFTISFFLRTLKPGGLVFQLRRRDVPYLNIYLRNGTMAFSGHAHIILADSLLLADGQRHLVTVKLRRGHVIFPKARGSGSLGKMVSVEAGDVAHVGGLPPGNKSLSWGGHFKGCLQDVRLDDARLTVEEPAGEEDYVPLVYDNVLEDCVSDQSCQGQPCLNGGTCEVTWNDFKCHCPESFSGKACEQRVWCVTEPCAAGSQCVDLPDGYECLANATFENNALQFVANGSLVDPVTSVSMVLRTREENATLLRAADGGNIFCLGLLNSYLLVKLHSNSLELLVFASEVLVSDGNWHRLRLTMADPRQVASRWYLTVDGRRVGSSSSSGNNLNFLNDTTVWLAQNFTGCLGHVRVGGVHLPLTDQADVPQSSRFLKQGGQSPLIGCRGAPVCQPNPCLNQGTCQDLFNLHSCSCAPGWDGLFCQRDADECASGPCIHGNCTDLLADYRCECQAGYGGRDCQEELDNCLEHSCLNGGLCLEATGSHKCACPEGFTGRRCQWRFPALDCNVLTCLAGGVCMDGIWGANCTCKPGYTGERCETQIDTCESSPCLNGATCVAGHDGFLCECAEGFSGSLCDSFKQKQSDRVPWLVIAIPLGSLCVLLCIIVLVFMVLTARKKRQSEGTYSPSAQEVAGARLEMGSVLKVPPEERLI